MAKKMKKSMICFLYSYKTTCAGLFCMALGTVCLYQDKTTEGYALIALGAGLVAAKDADK